MAETMLNESSMVEIAYEMNQSVEDEVTIQMKEMIQGCRDGSFLPECCIYRVPIVLRQLKKKAFTPNLVSIGPFHHGDKRLQGMERHKQMLFKRFTERACEAKSSLDDLVRCVKDLEPKVRDSYADTISYTQEELVKLTLVDAAFIIEFIMQMYGELDDNDVTVSQPWLANSIILDLILLENQLPFFVIEELLKKALPHDRGSSPPSFLRLACSFLGHNGQILESKPEIQIKHFTDLIRWLYLQGKMTEQQLPSKAQNHIRYNANALQEAGIKFKSRESKCLSDLKFSRHTLEIPQIDVDGNTEILFRNMIALEQCHYPQASYITEYTAIMYCLIKSYKDVDILVHNKIVSDNLGDSKKVASLFKRLGENVLQGSFNAKYHDICKELDRYWYKKRATLRRDYCKPLRRGYFNTPWRTVASVAGIILLLLTVAQTIFSALQVY